MCGFWGTFDEWFYNCTSECSDRSQLGFFEALQWREWNQHVLFRYDHLLLLFMPLKSGCGTCNDHCLSVEMGNKGLWGWNMFHHLQGLWWNLTSAVRIMFLVLCVAWLWVDLSWACVTCSLSLYHPRYRDSLIWLLDQLFSSYFIGFWVVQCIG